MSIAPPLRRLGSAPKRRVGLFGGSFNPAHEGHAHIAREALKRLDLDEVWLIVSPQNPLKDADGMAPLAARLASAHAVCARHPRLKAVALETWLGTRYTADTLEACARRFPRTRFVWVMGADNLLQFDRWQRWRNIFNTMVIAVFARPTAWAYFPVRLHPASATRIRAGLKAPWPRELKSGTPKKVNRR